VRFAHIPTGIHLSDLTASSTLQAKNEAIANAAANPMTELPRRDKVAGSSLLGA
jgi:hypothetical protein